MDYKEVQGLAKDTMEYARKTVRAGMTLMEVRELCEKKLLELGADSFWYWDIGAFVFAGDETAVSVSGPKYQTSGRIIRENDIITIDLSPQCGDIWGDYARTFIVENGVVVDSEACSNEEWKQGIAMEKELHRKMRSFVTPDTTFEELYEYMNQVIKENGYQHCRFQIRL